MSKTGKRAGIALHKAEQATEEIVKIQQVLYQNSTGQIIVGLIIVTATIMYDIVAPLLEIQYAPGFGRQQIFLLLFGCGLITAGIRGLQ